MPKNWSERAKAVAGKGAAAARERAATAGNATGQRIASHSGEDNVYGRIAAVLGLDDTEPAVRLESFVTALIRAVRQEDQENLRETDVIKAATRRQRWIGAACLPAGLAGVYVSSLYNEAAILCHVEQLHRLGLDDEQLAAHLLALWKVLPTYDVAHAAVRGTGPSVAEYYADQYHDMKSAGLNKAGEIRKREALKFLWSHRKVAGKAAEVTPGTINPKDVLLPKGRVKEVVELATKQLGVPLRP